MSHSVDSLAVEEILSGMLLAFVLLSLTVLETSEIKVVMKTRMIQKLVSLFTMAPMIPGLSTDLWVIKFYNDNFHYCINDILKTFLS